MKYVETFLYLFFNPQMKLLARYAKQFALQKSSNCYVDFICRVIRAALEKIKEIKRLHEKSTKQRNGKSASIHYSLNSYTAYLFI